MKWIEENNELKQSFTFKNFAEAWTFMNKVATISERINHHPKWCNSYNSVSISLSTHEAGNRITEKDYELASLIDALLQDN